MPISRLIMAGRHGVFLLLLIAGLSKIIDADSFAASLDSWTLIPAPIRGVLPAAVPLIELGIGAAWLLGVWRWTALLGAVALLACFTAMYTLHLVLVGPPECRCLGLIAAYEASRDSATMLLTRNGALLGILLASALCRPGGQPEDRPAMPRGRPSLRSAAGGGARHRQVVGFSLLETVIGIALIAVLVAMLIPSLARVRGEALELKSLSNLRTHATNVHAYAGDYSDSNPYLTDPLATGTILRGGGASVLVPFFFLYPTWNIALADEYYAGNPLHDSLQVPWKPSFAPPWPPYTLYWYPDCLISRPEYWNPQTRRSDRSQWRATSLAEIAFPSLKGIILEQGWTSHSSPPRLYGGGIRFALADGAAIERPQRDLSSPYATGSDPGVAPAADYGIPVMHTINGVRGRDIQN